MGAVVIHLCAKNNPSSGNPRRLYVVYDSTTGAMVRVFDEGYGGCSAMRKEYPNAVDLGSVQIPPAEYRDIRVLATKRKILVHS